MTPEEAGRRAEALASQLPKVQNAMGSILAHTGVRHDQPNVAMAPALHFASTYTRPADGPYHGSDSKYTRMDNPTRLALQREVARLETHGKDHSGEVICCAFASGMMAASSIVLAHSTPLHILLPVDLYHGVPTVLHDVFSRFQVTVEQVDLTNEYALKSALANASAASDVIVWIETPSNPLCHVIDISAICTAVRQIRSSSTVVVDSTLAPPTLTQPLTLGADFVLHSATKYLGGHSDVLLGCVTASPWTERGLALGPILEQTQIAVGGVASAMDSWLTLRGLRTLGVRVQRQCETASRLAEFLVEHPLVHAVHYPGLVSKRYPKQHAIAGLQMKNGFGGVLSVEMESESKAMALAGALRTIQRATSLGGTETLIEHRASIEPIGRTTSPVGLLRLAVGLEDANDLIRDLKASLEIVVKLHEKR